GMVVAGLTQGMQPIVGYNFGARRMDRVSRTLRLSITAGTVVTAVGFLIFEIFPRPISRLFTTDPELLQLTVSGMRLSSLAFVIVGSQIVISSFFQSIGQARMAVFLTTTRQLLFLIPALIVLPLFFGLDGVWLSLPLSDTLSEFVTVIMLVYYMKKMPYTHSSDAV
ncbi:MAG: MATE family efflux transporter, partial [bacterium]|nr:MATE family efflux transporter [bacterium]